MTDAYYEELMDKVADVPLETLMERLGRLERMVHITLPMTEQQVIDVWGERCDEVDEDCCVCRAWHDWDTTKQTSVLVEPDKVIALLIKGEI